MPIYEYECTKCGNHTEALQKFSDSPLTECEICKGKLKKLISHSTFHLKGSGWYVTDYASKTGGNQASHTSSSNNSSASNAGDSTNTASKKESSTDGSQKGSAKKESKDK